jgi:cell division protein FtsL
MSNAQRRNPQTQKSQERSRNRIRDARLALSEPAQVIAQRARSRYEQADKAIRLPSRKPRVVATPSRKDNSFVWVMRLFALGIVVSLFAVVGIQTTIAKRQITIDELRTAQKKEITKFEKNRHEVAKLKSPERITRRAASLGLVQPARFVSISIPMEVAARSDVQDDELWREVKAIVNATS